MTVPRRLRHAARAGLRASCALSMTIGLMFGQRTLRAQSETVRETGGDVVLARLVPKQDVLPDARLPLGWRSMYAAALNDRGEVAVSMHLPPGSLIAFYAADGSARWSVEVAESRVESVAIAGDTVAYLERFEHTSFLVLVSRHDGSMFDRRPISLTGFEQTRVLGTFKGEWHVQVSELAGEYKAARFPYRELRRYDTSSRSWIVVANRADSSPRAIAPNGVDALPPPFAPSPRFALSSTAGLFFAGSNGWDIESVTTTGGFNSRIHLQPLDRDLTDDEWRRVVADWTANPPLNMAGYAPALYVEAAAKGRQAFGRTISSIFANSEGGVLVRRRDADVLSSATPIESIWDLLTPKSDTLHRFRLAPNQAILAFASPASLLIREMDAQGAAKLHIVEIR